MPEDNTLDLPGSAYKLNECPKTHVKRRVNMLATVAGGLLHPLPCQRIHVDVA